MKKIVLAALAAATAMSGAQATSFTYSATFDSGSAPVNSIVGTFDGDLNGNLITNLSNITAIFNGVVFNGSGALYASHYDTTDPRGFVTGGGFASLDGTQNNFLFIDRDYPDQQDFTNYYYSITGSNFAATYGYDAPDNAYIATPYTYASASTATPTHFTAQAVASDVPEPASWAMMVGGFGLMGAAMRRQKATVRFA